MKIKDLPKDIKKIAKKRATCDGNHLALSFTWNHTEEGWDFWNEINNGNFDVFYNKKAEDIKVVYEVVPSARIIDGPQYSIHPPATFGREKTDPIVDSVIKQFRDRSRVGIEKYGTTLQDNNLTTLEWINHAQQEAMDFCLYLEKLKQLHYAV